MTVDLESFEMFCRKVQVGRAHPAEIASYMRDLTNEMAALPEEIRDRPILIKASMLLTAFALASMDRALLEATSTGPGEKTS